MVEMQQNRKDPVAARPAPEVPPGIEVVTTFKVGGESFTDLRKAVAYMAERDEVNSIHDMLPRAVDDHLIFAGGGGYIQHRPEALELFTAAVGDVIRKYAGDELADIYAQNPKSGYVSAVLSESDHLLSGLHERLLCTDANLREWGQQFYVNNPGSGTEVEWPDVV